MGDSSLGLISSSVLRHFNMAEAALVAINAGSEIVGSMQFLLTPATGHVTFVSTEKCQVKTYDEKDAVNWVSYEMVDILPDQEIHLSARGTKYIKLWISPQNQMFTADLGSSYIYNGRKLTKVTNGSSS